MGELMTVLVTGGAGYIGSHMVQALAGSRESVVVIDTCPRDSVRSDRLPEARAAVHRRRRRRKPGRGRHRGAQRGEHHSLCRLRGVPDSMRDPLAYYRNNTMTTPQPV